MHAPLRLVGSSMFTTSLPTPFQLFGDPVPNETFHHDHVAAAWPCSQRRNLPPSGGISALRNSRTYSPHTLISIAVTENCPKGQEDKPQETRAVIVMCATRHPCRE